MVMIEHFFSADVRNLYFDVPETGGSTLLSWNMTPFYVGLYQLLSASIIFSSLAQSQNASQKQIRGLNLEIQLFK